MSLEEADTPRAAPSGDEGRTVAELVGQLVDQTGTLMRQEIQLATTEMTKKASFAARQAVYLAVGLLLGVVSLLALLGALVFGLATVIALWKSALVVGLVAAALGILVGWKGIASLRDLSIVPKQTLLSLKEDKQWIQQQAR
ncbi:MAG: phage holin family protein [Polyangiaceae bacterium]